MSSPVCVICAENWNKNTRAPIQCEYCECTACKQCCETYIVGIGVPKCMDGKCGKVWTRKFMVNTFTGKFITGTWKKTVEKKLLDKEMALLPETQPFVEEVERIEKINIQIAAIDAKMKKLSNAKLALIRSKEQPVQEKEAYTKKFVRACPDSECRGFLSTQWKCGLCEKWSCPDCHAIKGMEQHAEHVCNPDEVASALLLAKDTKPCPECSTGIFKIDGCDQMWCTQCHVAFSWKSGLIETKIHNPHFYEWQRSQGTLQREPGDVVCGREITHHTMELVYSLKKTNNQAYLHFRCLITNLNHLKHVQMRQYRPNPATEQAEERSLRVMYMRRLIDLNTFSSKIQQANKKKEKNREMFQLLTMFDETINEIFFRVIQELRENPGKNVVQEFSAITNYANDCLLDIARTYKVTPLCITPITEAPTVNSNDILIKKPRDEKMAAAAEVVAADAICFKIARAEQESLNTVAAIAARVMGVRRPDLMAAARFWQL